MAEKRIYIAIDNVADGPMLVDDKKKLLTEIQGKYPDATTAVPNEPGSEVIVVTTKKVNP